MRRVLKVFLIGVLAAFGFLFYRKNVSIVAVSKLSGQVATVPAVGTVADSSLASDFVAVARVIDGDTVDVSENGKGVRVRLLGINTPETLDPRKPVECFGPEASKKMHELLDDGEVRLETDPSQGLYDKYGRTLAYVFLPDGTDVNKLLVTQGFASEYTYKKPYKLQKEFRAAEAAAKLSGVGLWSACR